MPRPIRVSVAYKIQPPTSRHHACEIKFSLTCFHENLNRMADSCKIKQKKCPLRKVEGTSMRRGWKCGRFFVRLKVKRERRGANGSAQNRTIHRRRTKTSGTDPAAVGGTAFDQRQDHLQVGVWSFPKLKIPHQSHADFCSTDTAGGLDNKKRRYAPRGGVAYRLFLWGFPKGATPPFGTRLCEAKCSVLYALSALP